MEAAHAATENLMGRFTDAQLQKRALAVLEDATNRAHKSKLGEEPALAFVLAWLANQHDERDMFDWFWKSRASDDLGRTQNMSAALNGIYRVVGEKRF